MGSSYHGLYKCEPKQDRPTHIRVIDVQGNELTIPVEDYEQRGMTPLWRDLPWQSEFKR